MTSTGDDVVLLAEKDERQGAPMNGPLIVRSDGTPVWVQPMGSTRWAYDLRVQTYQANRC